MSVVTASVLEAAGITHVSPSSLNRYMRCAENYRRRYVLGEKDPAGPKALLGSADSVAFAFYYEQRMGGVETPLDTITDLFRDAVVAQDGDYDLEDETTDSLIDIGVPTIKAYHAVAITMPDPVAVEFKIVIERDTLPVPIIGYGDVKFEHRGIDRKGAANKSVHPDWRIQNLIYSAAESLPWGWHVTSRTRTPAVYTPENSGEAYETPWSEARASKTIRFVGQLIGSIEANLLMFGPDEPWPTTGMSHQWACGKCPYKSTCPAWS